MGANNQLGGHAGNEGNEDLTKGVTPTNNVEPAAKESAPSPAAKQGARLGAFGAQGASPVEPKSATQAAASSMTASGSAPVSGGKTIPGTHSPFDTKAASGSRTASDAQVSAGNAPVSGTQSAPVPKTASGTASGKKQKKGRSRSMVVAAAKASAANNGAATKLAAGKNGRFVTRNKLLIGAAIAVVVIVVVVVLVVNTLRHGGEGADGALVVDGTSVSVDEFQFAVDSVKNDVLIEKAPDGSSVGREFWQDSSEGSASYEAAEKAIDVVKQRHAFYQVVADAGLVDSPSWEALYARFEKENASRQSDQSLGETVYGLESFDLPTFITYEQGVLEEQYVNDQSNPGMDVSEEQIQQHFESKQWTLGDGQPATLEEVKSAVVNDLRRSIFQDLVKQKVQQMQVTADVPSLAAQVAAHLG